MTLIPQHRSGKWDRRGIVKKKHRENKHFCMYWDKMGKGSSLIVAHFVRNFSLLESNTSLVLELQGANSIPWTMLGKVVC